MDPDHYDRSSHYRGKSKKSRKSRNPLKDEFINRNLKEENALMRKELHKLRKMEAGWFGKNKKFVRKEVIVKNNHYLEEKEYISNELTSIQKKLSLVEKEKHGLLNRVKMLEGQLSSLNTKFSNDKDSWHKERSSLLAQIEALNKKLDVLSNQKQLVHTQRIVESDKTDYDGIINQYKSKIENLNK